MIVVDKHGKKKMELLSYIVNLVVIIELVLTKAKGREKKEKSKSALTTIVVRSSEE